MFFSQTFDPHDLIVVGLLIILEGVLSIDNALVLGLLAKRLPKHQQSRALTYGLIGAFVFRLIAIATATFLLQWTIAKLLGGLYLVYVAVKHFFFERGDSTHENVVVGEDGMPTLIDQGTGLPLTRAEENQEIKTRSSVAAGVGRFPAFWTTVAVIELTDIAFAVDSILAAIALVGGTPDGHVGPHPKLWVIVTGGMLGVVLMRFAAVVFIRLLERFPRFDSSAYLLVVVIGMKLVLDWAFGLDFHHPNHQGDINYAFWGFWILMLACFAVGFIPRRGKGVAGS